MNRKHFAAVLAGIAAGATGYVVRPTPEPTDQELLTMVMERAGKGDIQELAKTVDDAIKADEMPHWVKRNKLLVDATETELLAEPAGRCIHCDRPSVALFPDGPKYLRLCPGCDRRWTMWLSHGVSRGTWYRGEWVPRFDRSMREVQP